MKVQCIRNGEREKYLTIGKIYYVIDEDADEYLIIDDDDDEWPYIKQRFKPLSEIRNESINKLLSDES